MFPVAVVRAHWNLPRHRATVSVPRHGTGGSVERALARQARIQSLRSRHATKRSPLPLTLLRLAQEQEG